MIIKEKLTLLILHKTIKMTSKFFGNSKLSNSKGNKNKNVISSKSKRKSFAVKKLEEINYLF